MGNFAPLTFADKFHLWLQPVSSERVHYPDGWRWCSHVARSVDREERDR